MLHAVKEKGSALLTALFIMTLVAIVATAMTSRLQFDLYKTKLLVIHDQLYLASDTVNFWALDTLNHKRLPHFKKISRGKLAEYPKTDMQSHHGRIEVTGALYDLQARLNINNLSTGKSIALFIQLLKGLVHEMNQLESINLALALRDWLSPYDLSQGADQFTSYYIKQNPPYYPSHQLMGHHSELRLVKGVSPIIYLSLEPFITALPEPTPINILTAPKILLKSLGNGLNDQQLEELMNVRKEKGAKQVQQMHEVLKKLNISAQAVSLESQYFLCIAQASIEDASTLRYAVIKRTQDKNGAVFAGIISESINGF